MLIQCDIHQRARQQFLYKSPYYQSGTSQESSCITVRSGVQESINSLTCVHKSVSGSAGCGSLASAQPHALLLAHVGAHKEGFQLPFPLDVDESSTLTRVAKLLQHVRRFLCYLEVDTEHTLSKVHYEQQMYNILCMLLNSYTEM